MSFPSAGYRIEGMGNCLVLVPNGFINNVDEEKVFIERPLVRRNGPGPYFKALRPCQPHTRNIEMIRNGVISTTQFGYNSLKTTETYSTISTGGVFAIGNCVTVVSVEHNKFNDSGRFSIARYVYFYTRDSGSSKGKRYIWSWTNNLASSGFPLEMHSLYELLYRACDKISVPYRKYYVSSFEGHNKFVRHILNGYIKPETTSIGEPYSDTEYTLTPKGIEALSADLTGEFHYPLREYAAFSFMVDCNAYLAPFASGLSTAYADAAANLPVATNNTIANIMEAVSFLRGVITLKRNPLNGIGKLLRGCIDPRDAWLKYRYLYKTTMLDAEEYTSVVKRLVDLQTLCTGTITVHGIFQDEAAHITYRACFDVSVGDLIPTSVSENLHVIGIDPSLKNIWDMIPWSFVIDWFLSVSNIFEWVESWANSISIKPGNIWYSVQTRQKDQITYFRVRGSYPGTPPRLVTRDVSNKTFLMRVADSISLFT